MNTRLHKTPAEAESQADVARQQVSAEASPGRPVSGFDRWLGRQLLSLAGNPAVELALWDEEPLNPIGSFDVTRLTVRDRRTLLRLARDPFVEFAEGYLNGHIDVDGDLVELCRAVEEARVPGQHPRLFDRRSWRRHRNTLEGSRSNIHHHYDLGNDFYRLWLDNQLLYSCAYFEEPNLSLEAAQIAKMDHVCRKLRLEPGQTVVEAGCGWGGLSLHMARHYGVRVRAYNISHEQIRFARQRAEVEGLQGRVEFVEEDWRSISGQHDVFVSVGMLEHVGIENYETLGDVIYRSLQPMGLGLIHTIGRNMPQPMDRWINRRIFPGAEPPCLREMMAVFEGHEFSVLDVENLRLHYAETLRRWLNRYESHVETVRHMFDDSFVRAWRLYLAGSMAAFLSGSLQLFQVTFAHPRNNQIPWNRAHIYQQHSVETGSARHFEPVVSQPAPQSPLEATPVRSKEDERLSTRGRV